MYAVSYETITFSVAPAHPGATLFYGFGACQNQSQSVDTTRALDNMP